VEEAMADGPTPETRFQAWGEAVYGLTRDVPGQNPIHGLVVLFQISDANREWASWYYFNTDLVPDIELLGSTHEVLAEGHKSGSHFVAKKPMRVDELCGTAGAGSVPLRRAVIQKGHQHFGNDVSELSLFIQAAPGMTSQISVDDLPTTRPLHLNIKRIGDASALDDLKIVFGWVTATGIYEKFNFMWPYHNSHEKLKSFEQTLTTGSSWVMRQ
jgi:hypothetical protein